MTKDELLDQAIYWFKIIDEDLRHLTTGNLPHNAATTRGRAYRAFKFLEEHKNDEEPQKLWKPTEEQIEALEHFVRSVGESGYASPYDNNTKLIYSLLEQLKRL